MLGSERFLFDDRGIQHSDDKIVGVVKCSSGAIYILLISHIEHTIQHTKMFINFYLE